MAKSKSNGDGNGKKRQTALVTGASGGIGLELARVLAREGYDLVLVARRKDELEKLAKELTKDHGVEATVVATDLGDPSAPDKLFASLKNTPIDVLVNNAGFVRFTSAATLSWICWRSRVFSISQNFP